MLIDIGHTRMELKSKVRLSSHVSRVRSMCMRFVYIEQVPIRSEFLLFGVSRTICVAIHKNKTVNDWKLISNKSLDHIKHSDQYYKIERQVDRNI